VIDVVEVNLCDAVVEHVNQLVSQDLANLLRARTKIGADHHLKKIKQKLQLKLFVANKAAPITYVELRIPHS
jgi:hypothetical protein